VSAIDKWGLKVRLPRLGCDEFWQRIHEHYAGDDVRKWKYLAMLALREAGGWNLEQIGLAFGHPKGHVMRCLVQIKEELRARFEVRWDADDDLAPDARSGGPGAGEVGGDGTSASPSRPAPRRRAPHQEVPGWK